MRPSIMSLGATMSTPASACTSACSREHGHGAVVDDVAAVVEQPVLAVAGEGVERHVGQHAQFAGSASSARAPRAAPGRPGWWPRGRRASSATGSITGNSAITGMPSATHSSAAANSRSMLRRCTPGMLGTSCVWLRAVEHEHRQDQVLRRQALLAHQCAGEGVAAQAARAAGGIGRGRVQGGRPVSVAAAAPARRPAAGPDEAPPTRGNRSITNAFASARVEIE